MITITSLSSHKYSYSRYSEGPRWKKLLKLQNNRCCNETSISLKYNCFIWRTEEGRCIFLFILASLHPSCIEYIFVRFSHCRYLTFNYIYLKLLIVSKYSCQNESYIVEAYRLSQKSFLIVNFIHSTWLIILVYNHFK